MTGDDLLVIIGTFLRIMAYLIIARALTSWFPDSRNHPIVQILYQITDPILVPLSRIVPRIGMIDISPMIAVIVLFILAEAFGAPGGGF